MVLSLKLNGVVDPFMASYVKRGIGQANAEKDAAVLLTIDTPGGLDSSMRAQLSPPKIAQLQSALTSKYGAFQSIKEVHQTAVEGHKTIELIAPYEHALLSIRVVFDDASRVAGIKFAPVAR